MLAYPNNILANQCELSFANPLSRKPLLRTSNNSAGTKRWDLLSSLATSHCWHPCFGVGTRIAFWPSQTVGLSARHFLLPICFGMAWHDMARQGIPLDGIVCVCLHVVTSLHTPITYTHIYSYTSCILVSHWLIYCMVLHVYKCHMDKAETSVSQDMNLNLLALLLH